MPFKCNLHRYNPEETTLSELPAVVGGCSS